MKFTTVVFDESSNISIEEAYNDFGKLLGWFVGLRRTEDHEGTIYQTRDMAERAFINATQIYLLFNKIALDNSFKRFIIN